MKKLIYTLSVLFSIVLFIECKSSKEFAPENQLSQDEYSAIIKQKKYTFVPHQIIPMSGKARYLTSDYSVKISNDTLDVYLPYFGRAYTAPMSSSDGGIKFVSTDFSYSMKEKKSGSYEIVIKPKDITSTMNAGITLQFTLNDNGSGSLYITSTNRQPVNFYGIFK